MGDKNKEAQALTEIDEIIEEARKRRPPGWRRFEPDSEAAERARADEEAEREAVKLAERARWPREVLIAVVAEYVDLIASRDSRRHRGSPELVLVRAAHRAVAEITDLVEERLNETIIAAWRGGQRRHALAEIGREMGMTGQAVGKRLRARNVTQDSSAPQSSDATTGAYRLFRLR